MKRSLILILLMISFTTACSNNESKMISSSEDMKKEPVTYGSKVEIATLAGGCFWCIEAPYEKIDGVIKAISGYAGGTKKDPNYSEVSSGNTDHRESVQVYFDPAVISYSEIISIFWKQFDPTDEGGSFYDRGFQYSSAIFYMNEEQKEIAERSKRELDMSGIFDDPIVTPVIEFTTFYPAEEYHQDFYKKDPNRYYSYREGSGRDEFINKHWDNKEYQKPTDEEIKKMLNDLQYRVTQEDGTERAFNNEYWDNKREGIYVDIVSGEPLFSSKDKFESGTGWPSFTKPIDTKFIVKKIDKSFGMNRIEVRSKYADSHLGHVFNDGIEPTGIRYCMNSAAMRFIPKSKMQAEGYGKYLWRVE